jgi:2,3-bisphosphoglycerate-dependent phosphoglycerate mutase
MTINNFATLVLVRHGKSEWNKRDLFTGWVDVDLAPEGVDEAKNAGQKLKDLNLKFSCAHSSVLKRAIKTCWLILDTMDQVNIPLQYSWRLNERHYGDLQGKNKEQTRKEFGEDQVKIWRRSYDIRPPQLTTPQSIPANYEGLSSMPKGESLKDTVERVLPYWESELLPKLKLGKNVLVVAHGNSLRGLVKHLLKMNDQDIVQFEIATGDPLVFTFDSNLNVHFDSKKSK